MAKPIVFKSRWTVRAPRSAVYELLTDVDGLRGWLPEVFVEARELAPDQGRRRASLSFRGFLPYTLEVLASIDSDPGRGSIRIEADGDLAGIGLWKISEEGGGSAVSFACSIQPRRLFLSLGARLLWPLIALNHRWIMRRVRKRLADRLAPQT